MKMYNCKGDFTHLMLQIVSKYFKTTNCCEDSVRFNCVLNRSMDGGRCLQELQSQLSAYGVDCVRAALCTIIWDMVKLFYVHNTKLLSLSLNKSSRYVNDVSAVCRLVRIKDNIKFLQLLKNIYKNHCVSEMTDCVYWDELSIMLYNMNYTIK
ncbi:hypothetical protein [Ectropis obliqua nucleopolyhedrovirus]|uniref:Uncharacterized protein n=1 Tax=Ectropis obliqua nucleopolyhedrovirus TaxID=59376 RepID=A0EZ15_9ABAC|nr:hypothetical protein EONV_gp112 [Ectropis obliqua nucleopolyhedrovirus]ABI35795.1 hypothetical protein [Ectropis obliqua nucleopolyhedrovirus]QWV59621.1 hypothetical protein EONV_gp112 [Ectropis obliqua nucleopolyhedrovirus]UYO72908.1 hypothetical protein EONV-gp112 [Ectropis obliqua nucleopolyhedrovirus]